MAKRKLVSYKDILIEILVNGVGVLDTMKDSVSRATVRRTIRALNKQGKEAEATEVEKWYVETYGAIGRGRGAPVVGENRTYKVQQIRKNGPFLRLPLDSLGVSKGDVVKVAYAEGKISVESFVEASSEEEEAA